MSSKSLSTSQRSQASTWICERSQGHGCLPSYYDDYFSSFKDNVGGLLFITDYVVNISSFKDCVVPALVLKIG